MIQRIQTLYLLAAALFGGLMFVLPLASFTTGADTFTLTALGLRDAAGETVQPVIYLTVLLAAAVALPLVTVFLYKRRFVQLRFCVAELVLLLGVGVLTGVYCYLCHRFFAGCYELYLSTVKVTVVFPLAALVCDFLALRGVVRDEKLVRSLDRIR
ncbi:MAG: DUF4293 domain-containing protein [Alistipes sp.]|nr:DUF4293 domain-containing protein [Alistipes sp.]